MELSAGAIEAPLVPASSSRVVTLHEMPVGGHGTVLSVDQMSDECGARRLYDLGFRPGMLVRVARRSMLGGPRVYELADYELALRSQQARTIRVEAAA